MLSRNDYKFILPPWENRGAEFDSRPDKVVELDSEGTSHLFLLKAKKNLLFFREAHQSNDFLCALETPLFSRSPPEEELRQWMQTNATFVEDFWQQEVKAGCYGRCILGEHPHLEGTFLLFFQQNGHGWLREPWDESGLPFTYKPTLVSDTPLFEWGPESFPGSFKVFADNKQLWGQIETREMPEEAIAGRPLEWICGSQEELEQVTRWIASTDPAQWSDDTPKTFVFRCENDEGQAELSTIIQSGQWHAPSERQKALTDLALDFNTPVGISWEFCDGSSGRPPIRGSWATEGPEICFSFDPPSRHEQLEARHQLRDWFRDKVPSDEIEAWFSPDVPG